MKGVARRCWVCAALLLLCAFDAAAVERPAPFVAEYRSAKFPFSAKAEIRLLRAGEYFRYTMHSTVYLGFYRVTETYDCSIGRIRRDELYPLEYVHRDARKERRNLHVRFDQAAGVAHLTRGDGSTTQLRDLPQSVWDPLSIQLKLRTDAANAEVGARFDYAVAEKNGVKRYSASYDGIETILVGENSLEAARVTAESSKRPTIFWFAPKYGWLPVRMTIGQVTLELSSAPATAERPPSPPAAEPPRCD